MKFKEIYEASQAADQQFLLEKAITDVLAAGYDAATKQTDRPYDYYAHLSPEQYHRALQHSLVLLNAAGGGVKIEREEESGKTFYVVNFKETYDAYHKADELDDDDVDPDRIYHAYAFLRWHCGQVATMAGNYHYYLDNRQKDVTKANLRLLGFGSKANIKQQTQETIEQAFDRCVFFSSYYFPETKHAAVAFPWEQTLTAGIATVASVDNTTNATGALRTTQPQTQASQRRSTTVSTRDSLTSRASMVRNSLPKGVGFAEYPDFEDPADLKEGGRLFQAPMVVQGENNIQQEYTTGIMHNLVGAATALEEQTQASPENNINNYKEILQQADNPLRVYQASLAILGFSPYTPSITTAEIDQRLEAYQAYLQANPPLVDGVRVQSLMFTAAEFLKDYPAQQTYREQYQAHVKLLEIDDSKPQTIRSVQQAAAAKKTSLLQEIGSASAVVVTKAQIEQAEAFLKTNIDLFAEIKRKQDQQASADRPIFERIEKNVKAFADEYEDKNKFTIRASERAMQEVTNDINNIATAARQQPVENTLNAMQRFKRNIAINQHKLTQFDTKTFKFVHDFKLKTDKNDNEEAVLTRCEMSVDPDIQKRARAVRQLMDETKQNYAQKKQQLGEQLEQQTQALNRAIEQCEDFWEIQAQKNVVSNYKDRFFQLFSNDKRQDSARNFVKILQAVKAADHMEKAGQKYSPLERVEILLEYVRREKAYVKADHQKGFFAQMGWTGSRLYRKLEEEEKHLWHAQHLLKQQQSQIEQEAETLDPMRAARRLKKIIDDAQAKISLDKNPMESEFLTHGTELFAANEEVAAVQGEDLITILRKQADYRAPLSPELSEKFKTMSAAQYETLTPEEQRQIYDYCVLMLGHADLATPLSYDKFEKIIAPGAEPFGRHLNDLVGAYALDKNNPAYFQDPIKRAVDFLHWHYSTWLIQRYREDQTADKGTSEAALHAALMMIGMPRHQKLTLENVDTHLQNYKRLFHQDVFLRFFTEADGWLIYHAQKAFLDAAELVKKTLSDRDKQWKEIEAKVQAAQQQYLTKDTKGKLAAGQYDQLNAQESPQVVQYAFAALGLNGKVEQTTLQALITKEPYQLYLAEHPRGDVARAVDFVQWHFQEMVRLQQGEEQRIQQYQTDYKKHMAVLKLTPENLTEENVRNAAAALSSGSSSSGINDESALVAENPAQAAVNFLIPYIQYFTRLAGLQLAIHSRKDIVSQVGRAYQGKGKTSEEEINQNNRITLHQLQSEIAILEELFAKGTDEVEFALSAETPIPRAKRFAQFKENIRIFCELINTELPIPSDWKDILKQAKQYPSEDVLKIVKEISGEIETPGIEVMNKQITDVIRRFRTLESTYALNANNSSSGVEVVKTPQLGILSRSLDSSTSVELGASSREKARK